jgi:hypothetical protein
VQGIRCRDGRRDLRLAQRQPDLVRDLQRHRHRGIDDDGLRAQVARLTAASRARRQNSSMSPPSPRRTPPTFPELPLDVSPGASAAPLRPDDFAAGRLSSRSHATLLAIVQTTEEDDAALPGPERNARHVLEGLGFVAWKWKIPTTSERTPDFEVGGDDPGYLVEVKSRLLDERLSKPTTPIGPPVEKFMRHDPKVGDWLADAKQQFRTLDPDHERLWFLWCSMEARFRGENQGERTISVLYGVREAHDVEPPHRIVVVFYGMPAAFDRFPDNRRCGGRAARKKPHHLLPERGEPEVRQGHDVEVGS